MGFKTIRFWYWIVTILFAAFMVFSGISEILQIPSAQTLMEHLGYPLYLNYIIGFAKILGAIAIVQTRWKTIKEWAYAGFSIDIIGAALSILFVGDPLSSALFTLLFLAIMFISYALWKKVEKIRHNNLLKY